MKTDACRLVLLLTAFAVATVIGARTAEAYTVRWCASSPVLYEDSDLQDDPNNREDFWYETDVATYKRVRGAEYLITNSSTGATVSSGYLSDGIASSTWAGCTAELTMAGGYYDFEVFSRGVIQNNTLQVGDTTFEDQSVLATDVGISSSTTKFVNFFPTGDTEEVFNVYQAAGWGLYRHAGGMTGKTYPIEVGNPTPCCETNPGSCGSSCNGTENGGPHRVFLGDSAIDRKFLIGHELGHKVGRWGTDSKLNAALDPTYTGNGGELTGQCPADDDDTLKSIEWVGHAVAEGFADFYAADIWNDHGEAECWTAEGLAVASCETGNTAYPNSWVDDETCRVPDDPESGSELDWMRIFWDIHTDPATVQPTFTDIVRWLDGAANWNKENAFVYIEEEAHDLDDDDITEDLCDNFSDAVAYNAGYYNPDLTCP